MIYKPNEVFGKDSQRFGLKTVKWAASDIEAAQAIASRAPKRCKGCLARILIPEIHRHFFAI